MLSLGFTPPISVLQRLDFSHLTRVDTTVSVQRAEDWTSLGLLLSSARRSLESIKIYYLYRDPPPAPAIVHSFLPNLKELELIITVAIPQYNPNHPYHPMRDLAPTPQTVSYLTTHLPNAGHPSLETIKIQLEWMADIVEGVTPPLGQARLLLDPGLQPEWPPLNAALSNPDSYPRLRSLEFIPLVTVYPARTERAPDLCALPTQRELKAEELRKQSWYQYAQQEVREIFTRTRRRLVESGGSFVTHTPEFDAYFRT
ncbi:hypothetical protein CC1G_15172 [Coprinopsis cinerea okayama7|uniref:Uncharacterized protein n=1 Tax=Coprinopsis cinerea (strain Okayama-7 / 130 / ATCC MYA-4618 / FGSC 9003) TaxID=240176 RepID=D6RPI1_COPC7|nr:hypothetical protein CC1G_15172 [Coprinopsis cinerea okayama7\|eukprot:XP_002910533.1 hypothetical protein CC1G_15172 [Coprinopsis cinerea okayama7\